MNQLKQRIDAAAGNEKADLLITNAWVADVFNHEIVKMDLAIKDGEFISSTKREAKEILDAEGMYLIPSFIDSHVHIESSMVTPAEFAKVVLPHGVTTVIADPHEIANVAGAEGIRFMLEQSEKLLLDVRMMLPSCVPAAAFEESGAVLRAEDLEPFADHPNVLGLAEVMDYPALLKGDGDMLRKISMANSRLMPIDGHLAGLSPEMIDVYRSAGIRTDHEVTTAEEALNRVRRGMYVQIRQGSVAQNLPAVVEAVSSRNARRFILCTDDKHLDELKEEGSIDHLVRLCIKSGIEPLTAIQMASLNAAECYGLKKKGAIAPGFEADFILTDDLEALPIRRVFRKGAEAATGGRMISRSTLEPIQAEKSLSDSVHIGSFPENRLVLSVPADQEVPVIQLIPNELVTKKRMEKTNACNGEFVPCTKRDHLKLAAVERHRASGKAGIGIVKGFKFTSGAIACTIAHDSHHIMAVGTHDAAIHAAIIRLQELKGGMAVAGETGRILAELPLSIGGLMSDRPYEEVIENMEKVHHSLKEIGYQEPFNPFVMLSFLALPVIPEIKLTVNGLFDVNAFTYLSF
ncbi:adenine deaminase [Bacillus mangrovi]|uniref:Adenine deaminase n=2 Tax=Metabacillus mangrovi TaxID=1491830 RepID=A0A7X2SAC3_9BACI|nr:adenine deaminase [Metabacillus mangrovi]MTH55401.1 adenine deaminase [Metabacillus mangrovi]